MREPAAGGTVDGEMDTVIRVGALREFTRTRTSDAAELLACAARLFHVELSSVGVWRGGVHEVRGVEDRDFSVGYIESEAGVRTAPGAYFLNIGVTGRMYTRRRGEATVLRTGTAALFGPGDGQEFQPAGPSASALALRLSPSFVHSELAALLGHDVDAPVGFDLALDLRDAGGKAVAMLVGSLLDQLDSGDPVFQHVELQRGQLRSIVTALLLAQPNSFSGELAQGGSPPRPRTLRKAMAYVQEHLAEPITLGDIARAADCSARTVGNCFQQHVGVSPMTYVRNERLDRIRDELAHSDDTVGEVAYRWGIGHLGRFARQYRLRFGESPSESSQRGASIARPRRGEHDHRGA